MSQIAEPRCPISWRHDFRYPLSRVIHSLLSLVSLGYYLSPSFACTQHLIVHSVWKFREAIGKQTWLVRRRSCLFSLFPWFTFPLSEVSFRAFYFTGCHQREFRTWSELDMCAHLLFTSLRGANTLQLYLRVTNSSGNESCGEFWNEKRRFKCCVC